MYTNYNLLQYIKRMSVTANPGSKVLATNGLIHFSGVCGMLDNMLGHADMSSFYLKLQLLCIPFF